MTVMISKPLQKVLAWARRYSAQNTALDKRFDHDVRVIAEDGSEHVWRSAFAVRYHDENGPWVVVFPEHDNVWADHETSLLHFAMYKQVEMDKVGDWPAEDE